MFPASSGCQHPGSGTKDQLARFWPHALEGGGADPPLYKSVPSRHGVHLGYMCIVTYTANSFVF